jgi:hypothetical protein
MKMKRTLLVSVLTLSAMSMMAQTDSTKEQDPPGDTIKLGGITIIRKGGVDGGDRGITFRRRTRTKPSNVSTNWFVFDLGFTNYNDKTDYASAETQAFAPTIASNQLNKSLMELKTAKSSNFNLWFFMQKLNLTKHVLNLKYGLGLEMNNFRYESPIRFTKGANTTMFLDTVSFSKNKLFCSYLTVPMMININSNPNTHRRSFQISFGASAGYLVGSRLKQVSEERGKQKIKDDFNLERWRVNLIGELGLGPVKLYGSYSLTPLMQNGLTQYPYSVGLRFSNL